MERNNPPLLGLSTELLVMIAKQLVSERDIGAMAGTSRRLYDASIHHLYQQNLRRSMGSALFWAAQRGRIGTLRQAHAAGIVVSRIDVMEEAAKNGHVEVFRLLYSLDGEAITQLPWDLAGDASPLSLAAEHGHADLVGYLCQVGFDMEYGWSTPLTRAAGRGHRETVRCLLQHGANTAGNADGKPPLLHAIYAYDADLEVVRLLLEGGSDANYTTSWGTPLLHYAVSDGNFRLVELLVDHGADASTADAKGQTPLSLAIVRFKNQAAIALLDKAVAVGGTPMPSGMTPLQLAVDVGNTELARMLLARGVDPLARHPETGMTALHVAAKRDDTEIARLLLEHGARVETRDVDGLTAIQLALRSSNIEVFRVLLEHVADVNALVTETGWSLLHQASKDGKRGIVQVLLANPGIDIERRDLFGRTALFLAARTGQSHIIEELLSKGASATAKDQYGAMPIFATVRNGHVYATELLFKAAPDVFQQRDGLGHTLFWWALRCGKTEVREALLHHAAVAGASIDVDDSTVDIPRVDFHEYEDFCQVCTRCVDCFADKPPWRCPLCHGGVFLICSSCAFAHGIGCPGGESHADEWISWDSSIYVKVT